LNRDLKMAPIHNGVGVRDVTTSILPANQILRLGR